MENKINGLKDKIMILLIYNEKNRINYSFFESKYSSKNNYDRDCYSFKSNRINDNNIIYSNENYNISNISSSKNVTTYRRFDSNFNLKNEIENSDVGDKISQKHLIKKK